MTLYRAVVNHADDNQEPDEATTELDDRDLAIEWAVGRLTTEHDTVVLEHHGDGGWERIGVFDADQGSGPDVAMPGVD